MGGSQLTQLKSDLRSSGLSRVSQPKDAKKKAALKRQQSTLAQARKADRIDEIRDKYNQFDIRKEKPKFQFVGRGGRQDSERVSGAPTQSRTASHEMRKKTLLPLLEKRAHNSSFVDRRFGETASHLTPEERALQRFAAERQYKLDLDDTGDDFALTHGGRSLDDGADLGDNGWGGLGDDDVVRTRNEDNSDDEPPKRTHAEIMKEVMAKSKMYKQERRRIRNEDNDMRLELDDELKDIRLDLGGKLPNHAHGQKNETSNDQLSSDSEAEDSSQESGSEEYSQESGSEESSSHPRTSRSSPEPASLDMDEGQLEQLLSKFGNADSQNNGTAEPQRDRYLAGSQDNGWGGSDRSNFITGIVPASGKPREDLDGISSDDEDISMDDYDRDVKRLSLERRARPSERLKTDAEAARERAEALAMEERDRLKRQHGEDEYDLRQGKKARVAQGDDLEDDFVLSGDEADDGGAFGEGLHEESDVGSDEQLPEEDNDISGATNVYPCPRNADDIIALAKEHNMSQDEIPELLNKIRVLYHPSVAPGNTQRLERFAAAVLDFVVHLAETQPKDRVFPVVNKFLPALLTLTRAHPLAMAQHTISRIKQAHTVLVHRLNAGQASEAWSDRGTLVLLRIIGFSWSTSDLWHPVAAPALLLLTQFLSQCPVSSLEHLLSGLFLCTVALQFEARSQRYVPEVFSFLQLALVLLLPKSPTKVQASFPTHLCDVLALRKTLSSKIIPSGSYSDRVSFSVNTSSKQARGNLAIVTLKATQTFLDQTHSKTGFPHVASTLLNILEHADISSMDASIAEAHRKLLESTQKRLRFSISGRRALLLQMHRQEAIPSFIPKFEESSSSRRAFDPDAARTQEKKLRNLVKREKKAAVREIRRDSEFIAHEARSRALAKDTQYNSKMNKLVGAISGERSEEKTAEKAKQKLRRRR